MFLVGCIYAMCVYGWRQLKVFPIKAFVITVVVNCVLIGLATVDWDNRFYITWNSALDCWLVEE
jgi:hypothetical protein